jgi:hypothetical protein
MTILNVALPSLAALAGALAVSLLVLRTPPPRAVRVRARRRP